MDTLAVASKKEDFQLFGLVCAVEALDVGVETLPLATMLVNPEVLFIILRDESKV